MLSLSKHVRRLPTLFDKLRVTATQIHLKTLRVSLRKTFAYFAVKPSHVLDSACLPARQARTDNTQIHLKILCVSAPDSYRDCGEIKLQNTFFHFTNNLSNLNQLIHDY
jgi:hypothetical protein